MKLIDRNSLSYTGLGALGIRVRNVALMSLLNFPLLWNSESMAQKSSFKKSQAAQIKLKLKPSGQGALSAPHLDKAALTSSSMNSLNNHTFKSAVIGSIHIN